ncbi:MAG: hypothetical protein JXB19_07595 [Bacteroidales bacterium]|nr:hypothetical protein [Bacteroidales bacterium]
MKFSIQIFLGFLIILLSYLLYGSIIQPIRFNRERDLRVEAAISRLTSIRKAQAAFKDVHNRYTDNFDTLIGFILYDSFAIQKKTGSYNPDLMNEREAVSLGLVEISSTSVSVRDSLFADHKSVDLIRYVPYTDQKEFTMNAGQIITGSGFAVQVFEVYVLYETLLHGMNEQLIVNYVADRERIAGFPGLKVGSMVEVTNNAGNWE